MYRLSSIKSSIDYSEETLHFWQDGSKGRHTLPLCTTKSHTTTNLKTKISQNCQKIKLYGSPTTKELKKKHSSRWVGGVETGSRGGEDSWQGSDWQSWWSHLCMQNNWGARQTSQPRVPVRGNKASKPLTENTRLVEVAGETSSLTAEFTGVTHRVIEGTQTPIWESAHNGPICLWVAEEVTESWLRAEEVALFPL